MRKKEESPISGDFFFCISLDFRHIKCRKINHKEFFMYKNFINYKKLFKALYALRSVNFLCSRIIEYGFNGETDFKNFPI